MGLDRIGTFKGEVIEWGVSKTRQKEMPQFVVRARLTEYYDQQESEWFDYTEDENGEAREVEINAYLCLYGANKKKGGKIGPTLSYDQVKKVFGWDGVSFAALANGDYSELIIQLRIGENTYEAATSPYQVNWIDEEDADPVRQLTKLNTAELKDLDKQFANLAKKPTKVATATAKKAAKPHPARVPADDKAPALMTKAEKNKILKAKSARLKAAAEAKPAVPEAPDKTPDETPEVPEAENTSCTKQQAWDGVVEMRDPTINDETIGELWRAAIKEVAGPKAVTKTGQKAITGEQWYQVKEIVLKDCGKF